MARNHVAVAVIPEFGRDLAAYIHATVAARMEFAAGRRVYGAGNIAA